MTGQVIALPGLTATARARTAATKQRARQVRKRMICALAADLPIDELLVRLVWLQEQLDRVDDALAAIEADQKAAP